MFRLVEDPYLQFIEEGSEAGTISYLGNKQSFRAISGDGFTYKTRFMLVKYFTELCGEGAAKFIEDPTLGFSLSPKGEILYNFKWEWEGREPFCCQLNLTKILTNASCGIFGWLFEELFGDLPTANSVVEIPKDPELPSEITAK